MKNSRIRKNLAVMFLAIGLGLAPAYSQTPPAANPAVAPATPAAVPPAPSLIPNGDLSKDSDGDKWPDGWPQAKANGSWEVEEGIHFIRLKSNTPDEMVMLYLEVPVPAGVTALELKFKGRVSNLALGSNVWFDARILMDFLNASREKVPGGKFSAPSFRKNTDGWVEKSVSFVVPEGTTMVALMPALFKVKSGSFDLTDITLTPVDAAPILEANAAAEAAKAADIAKKLAARQAKAAEILQAKGTLIPGGDYESGSGKNIVEEEGNHFLRLQSTEPGKMVLDYRTIDIPAGVPALELTWKQRVTGLKKGEMPWYDARIMMEWKDAAGGKISQKPSPPYAQKDTAGWVDKSTTFLVPEGAATLVLMPSLFQVQAGTFEVDNLVLKPTDPAPILAARADAEKAAAARYVPPEEPNKAKWPKMLKVVGNRLHDTDGKEFWLQGVNAGGLETLPQDTQAIKSVVVAIDVWKANCIRLPMNETFWYGKSPYQSDGGKEYRDKIDMIVTLAANRGAYVVIDLHRFRAPKQEHADFWKDAAEYFKDHPAVLFDVFNEPHGISWDVWKSGGFVGEKEGTDESAFLTAEEKAKNQGFQSVGMQGLVDAVRSTGAKNIVIAGGLFWCNDLSQITKGYALDDKGGNGIMYSWHTYNWHKGWEERVMATAEKYPIFLGEVGADTNKMSFIPAADQEDPYTWVPDMLGFIQKYKINWTGWCFHPRATPVMISDWNYTPTPYWGVFAKDALSGKQFEMKKMR